MVLLTLSKNIQLVVDFQSFISGVVQIPHVWWTVSFSRELWSKCIAVLCISVELLMKFITGTTGGRS